MKKIGCCFAVCLTLAASCFAGPMAPSKEYKAVEPTPCFGDHEFQADIFGAYAVTEAGQGAVIHDHAWGAGGGLNYFFTRWFGLGVDGTWLYGKPDNRRLDDDFDNNDHRKARSIGATSGSIILRYPIDSICLAPYLFVGGGAQWGAGCFGTAHWGGGVEYRIVPQKVGLFVDGRFTVLNDRSETRIHNPHFALVRAGLRFVF